MCWRWRSPYLAACSQLTAASTPALPQDRFVSNATQLYRSDFCPGRGWMLNRRVWESIRDRW